MRQIRVLVAGMPAFQADIVRRIVDEQADMSVVGEIGADDPVEEEVERARADVIVVGAVDTDPRDTWISLAWKHPWLRILALDNTGRRHSPVEIRRRGSAGETWPARVVEAIRHGGEPGGRTSSRDE